MEKNYADELDRISKLREQTEQEKLSEKSKKIEMALQRMNKREEDLLIKAKELKENSKKLK